MRNWAIVIVVIGFLLATIIIAPLQNDSFIQREGGENEMSLKIKSPVFGHNEKIPRRFTCDGEDISPPLEITGVPEGTQSLVLIMDDPDASGGNWDHWILYGLNPEDQIIPEDLAKNRYDDQNFSTGLNSWGKVSYGGPCPPSGEHRYFFKLYAVDTAFLFGVAPDKKTLENRIKDHIIEQAELIGKYEKQ